MITLLGKCDPKGRSHLTSQPPDLPRQRGQGGILWGTGASRTREGPGDSSTARCLSGDLQGGIAQEQLVSLCWVLCSGTAAM